VTGCQSRREMQKIPLSMARKKLMAFDRNNNGKSVIVNKAITNHCNKAKMSSTIQKK
jgi:hypothetical protein